jgi:hypothetical protein
VLRKIVYVNKLCAACVAAAAAQTTRRSFDEGRNGSSGSGGAAGISSLGSSSSSRTQQLAPSTPGQLQTRGVATLAAGALLTAGWPGSAAGHAFPPQHQPTAARIAPAPAQSPASYGLTALQAPSLTSAPPKAASAPTMSNSFAMPATPSAHAPPQAANSNGSSVGGGAHRTFEFESPHLIVLSDSPEPVLLPASKVSMSSGSTAAAAAVRGDVSTQPPRQLSFRKSLSNLGRKIRDSFSAPSSPMHDSAGSGASGGGSGGGCVTGGYQGSNGGAASGSSGSKLPAVAVQEGGQARAGPSTRRSGSLRQSAEDMWERVTKPADRAKGKREERAARRAALAQAPNAFMAALPLYASWRAPPREHVPHDAPR